MRKLFLLLVLVTFVTFCAISCHEDDVKPIEKYYDKEYILLHVTTFDSDCVWLKVKSKDTVTTIYVHSFDAENLKIGDTIKKK